MKSLSLGQPHAIVMLGIPGSGKSFFAQKFADTFGAPYVNVDDIAPHAASDKDAYALTSLLFEQLLKTKHSIVLETDTGTRQARAAIASKCKKAGYKPLFIWVQTDVDTAATRASKTKQIPADYFRAQVERFTPPTAAEGALVISGKHTYASQARVVLKKLSSAHTREATATNVRPQARGQIIIR